MAESNEQLYDQFADLTALDAQKKSILGMFSEIKQGLKSLADAGVKIDSSTGLKGLNEGLKKQKKANDELTISVDAYNKILTENARLQARINALGSDQAKELAKRKVQQTEMNKTLRDEAKEALGLTDAYTKLAKQYETAARNAQNLIITKGKEAAETKEAIALAQKLGKQLKDTDADVLKFQRNVGNYANSLGDGFELVRREINRLQREQKTLTIGGDTRGAEAAGRRVQELNDILHVSFDNTKNFDQVVKSLQKSFSTMATNGQQSNEFLEEFKVFVAQAKDQAEDLRAEIKALSSDTRKLDLAAGSVSFIADSFQLAAGTAQLLGASEEDAAKATAQLAAVQSVANGLKGIANELTTRGTAANKAYAFVQRQVNIVMTEGIATAKGLKAAMGLLLIAVTVIGGLAAAFGAFKSKMSEAAKEQERFNKISNDAAEAYVQQKLEIEQLVKKIKDENTSNEEKKRILSEVNEKYGDTFGKLNSIKELETEFVEKAPLFIKTLELKAKAQAAFGLATEAAKEALRGQILLDQVLSSGFSKEKAFGGIGIELADNIRDGINTAKKDQDAYLKYFDAYNKELEGINNKYKFNNPKPEKDKKDTSGDIAERNRRAIFERVKLELEQQAELQKEIVSIESFSYEERMAALRKYIALKTSVIEAEAKFEKETKGKTKEEIATIEAKKLADINTLSDEAIKLFTTTSKEAVQVAVEEMGELPDEAKAVFDKMAYELEQGIQNVLGKLTDAQKEAIAKIDKLFEEQDIKKRINDTYIDSFQTIASAANDILGGVFDRQKNQIQDQIDSIERLKAIEIERIQASSDGEEQKAARVKLIEAKAQTDREALERRQRQIDRQKAAAQKALTLFQLITDGHQAVGNAKLLALQAKLKYLAAGGPANPAAVGLGIAAALAQSQVFQTIITSAANIALAAAQPIPKFGTGTDSAPGGLSIVAERGREIGIDPTGNVTMYTKPTLTNLARGTKILNNQVTEDIMRASEDDRARMLGMFGRGQTAGTDYSAELEKQTDILKRIERKPPVIIRNHPAVESSAWYWTNIKN